MPIPTPSAAQQLAVSLFQLCCVTGGAPILVRCLIEPRNDCCDLIANPAEVLPHFDAITRANPVAPPAAPVKIDQRRAQKLSRAVIRQVRGLYKDGMHPDVIAKRFRVSPPTIIRHVRDLTRQKRTETAARRLITKVGVPVAEVSKQFGIPKAKLLMGLPKKKRKRKRASL